MALAKPSIFAAISGVLGGAEFAHSHGSTVIRKRKRRKPQPRAGERHAQLFHVHKWHLWRSLTDAQRLAWRTTAAANTYPDRFGVHRHLSAPQIFFRCIHNITPALLPSFFDPPQHGAIQAPQQVRFEFDLSNALRIRVPFMNQLPHSTLWLLQVHPPISTENAQPSRNWIYLADATPDQKLTLITTDYIELIRDFDTAILTALPNLQPGDIIPIRLKFLSPTYFPSAWFDYTATVAGA